MKLVVNTSKNNFKTKIGKIKFCKTPIEIGKPFSISSPVGDLYMIIYNFETRETPFTTG
jgi:hypothetical protein